MKILVSQVAIFICFLAAGYVVHAQENAAIEYEITDSERERYDHDKVIFSPGGEGEARYVSPRTQPTGSSSGVPKDSVASSTVKTIPVSPATRKEVPVKNPTKQIPPKQDEDAIMSFNFLYYIIQKYKLQEIIE